MCAQSPLFMLYTYYCNTQHGENSIVKCVDVTTIISWISNNDGSWYWEEITALAKSRTENNLPLSISKTTELLTDFRKKEGKTLTPIYISRAEVEQLMPISGNQHHREPVNIAHLHPG